MTNSGRREFLKNSMALALAPAAGSARLATGASAGSEPAQQLREDFFKGFKAEEIKTSGTTIHTVHGGNRNGPPLLPIAPRFDAAIRQAVTSAHGAASGRTGLD